jgi:hypothetical protein
MTDEVPLPVDDEFRAICREILAAGKAPAEWALIESDDMFQSERYEGGYDATEGECCFSRYDDAGGELWFQLSLDEVRQVVEGSLSELRGRRAEL